MQEEGPRIPAGPSAACGHCGPSRSHFCAPPDRVAINSWIRLNAATRSDLRWWLQFMEEWNGMAVMPCLTMPAIAVESDASGCWECGHAGGPSGSNGSGMMQCRIG